MNDWTDIQIGNPHFIWLCLVGLIIAGLAAWSEVATRRAMAGFATGNSGPGPGRSSLRRFISTALLVMSVVGLSLALMDIRWGKTTNEVPQKGLEVVFALDVSRSMLAEDVSPNRLERAKQQIRDMISEMAGDRVGLVIFAGEADQVIPLTSHYEDFRQVLDSVGPHSLRIGGSQLGVAIETAANAFIKKTNDHKTIVLITDGEDQESEPVKIAKRLHEENGTRVFTIGLGDMEQGARIPDDNSRSAGFVEHEGELVWSKLNGRILREIATETGAAYIPAGTARVNMADVYHRFVANVEKSEFDTAIIDTYIPRFQWFSGFALACLVLEVFVANRPDSRQRVFGSRGMPPGRLSTIPRSTSRTGGKKSAAAIPFLIACSPLVGTAQQTVAQQINEANQLVREQRAKEAVEAYSLIDASGSQLQAERDYNLAIAHYRNGNYPAASALFRESARSPDDRLAANSRYNLGNCLYASALSAIEQGQPDTAVAGLLESIDHYRSALRLNRDSADARANIERATRLIEEIKRQQTPKQEEQSGENADAEDRNQQQSEESGEENRQRSEKGNDQSSDHEEQSKGQEDSQSDEEASAGKQNQQESKQEENQATKGSENLSEEAKDGEQNQEQSASPTEKQQQSDAGESGNSNQPEKSEQTPPQPLQGKSESGEESPGQNQPEVPDEKQDAADQQNVPPRQGELTAAGENREQDGNESQATAGIVREEGFMTREEALKLLQSVRDRDMIRRLQQQQRQRSRRVLVEKDW